jgi:Rap1a immunity proteins
MVRILMLVVALSVIGGAAAWPRAARAQSDVQWLYRVCARDLSVDANAYCLTYTRAVADLMRMNCEIVKQRLSAGGLSNADDRRAMLSVASDARAIYGLAGAKFAFIDWANENPKRWNLPMVEVVMEALREKWPCESR